MVSRLVFKGDKGPIGKVKKVKKAKKKVVSEEKLQKDLDLEQLKTSWITAVSVSDLRGPIVLAFKEKNDVNILGVNPVGKLVKRSDFSVQDEPLSIPLDNIDLKEEIHRVEPDDVSTVFVIGSITGIIQPKVEGRIKVALKGTHGKYLSSDLECNSEAIGDSQIWELHLIKDEKGVWFQIYYNDKRLSIKDGVLSLTENFEDSEDLFVIRVQFRNSTIGKELISEAENKSQNETEVLKNAINTLQQTGISITSEVLNRLQKAIDAGKLNEQLIVERQNAKSDSRC